MMQPKLNVNVHDGPIASTMMTRTMIRNTTCVSQEKGHAKESG